MEYALITGITGFMVQQFIKEYMERYKNITVFAIIRNKKTRLLLTEQNCNNLKIT